MHIPDGYLSPQTYIPLYGVSAIFLGVALRKVRNNLSVRQVPYIAMAAAFSFLIQMFNIPVPGGTTGHAVGAGIIAILLGPWTAVLAVSVALIIQAVVFGDGGITAIGANCFDMAIVIPFVSYGVFRILRGRAQNGMRYNAAAFFAGYIGLTVASVCAGILFGIQPLVAHGPDGRPLFAPYPLSIAVPAMALEHLLLFGPLEGFTTVLVLRYISARRAELGEAIGKI
ncbi:MAG: cobalt transporter CbiM [Syntrophales bacterium]|jgi:cobalt/nickel transport system permease protein